jgi:Phosphodiester glycosidase
VEAKIALRYRSTAFGMTAWLAALLFGFVGIPAAHAEWQITSSRVEKSPNESLIYRRTLLENRASGMRARLDCAIFETKAATMETIDQPHSSGRDLAEVMAQRGALAGVNGGYFDPEDAPVGLLVSDGKILSPLRKAKLLTGVLFSTRNKVEITRANGFVVSRSIRSAVQCGPLLVERSAPIAGLDDARLARRTFAAVDGRGHGALGVCSAVSLAQLGRILALPNVLGEGKPVRALNLDGGSSSGFWFAGEQRVISIPELKPVRDFVAVVPRGSR